MNEKVLTTTDRAAHHPFRYRMSAALSLISNSGRTKSNGPKPNHRKHIASRTFAKIKSIFRSISSRRRSHAAAHLRNLRETSLLSTLSMGKPVLVESPLPASPASRPGAGVDRELWQAIADVRALRGMTGADGSATVSDASGGSAAGRFTILRLASSVDRQLSQALEDLRAVARAPPPACGGGCDGGGTEPDALDRQLYRAIGVFAPLSCIIYLSIYLSIHSSIHLFFHLSFFLSIYLGLSHFLSISDSRTSASP